MNSRIVAFISVIVLFLTISGLYLGLRVITRTNWGESHKSAIWLALGIFIVLQFLGPVLYRTSNQFFILQWIVYTTLGAFFCVLFYTMAGDFLGFIWKWLFPQNNVVDFDRRNFLLVTTAALGSAAVGIGQAKAGPQLYEVEVPIENLPTEFDGFRIVQISDLHIGPTIRRAYVENVVNRANELNADLIALTGDFVDGSVPQLENEIAPLKELKSRHGMFFVTGNHEYYWGVKDWITHFKELGAQVLLNENVIVRQGGASILLAGVTDISSEGMEGAHKSDPHKAISGANRDQIKILLAHQPKSYFEAEKAGFHLQLSGHTHGGQFFPFNLIVGMVQPYYKGLNQYQKMWIYVNRGTGYWGPPIRFAIPSEITLLKLRKA